MPRKLLKTIACPPILGIICCVALGGSAPPHTGTALQADFEAGRVYVQPVIDGRTFKFFTDTGGGLVISIAVAKQLGLKCSGVSNLNAKLGPGTEFCEPPTFPAGWPPVPSGAQMIAIPHVRQVAEWPDQGDGILGQAWFGGHVWTWDYPGKRLILRPDHWRPRHAHPAHLGFKGDGGKRALNFPRIEIRVDGQAIPVLLDTGAETLLTPAAVAAMRDSRPAFRSTSMIMHSIFEQWHTRHPGWPLIQDGQQGTHSRMIRVPGVEIADYTVGPVWFTERPDKNYRQFMSAMTDRPVEGSIGGNALEHFKMTLDYPEARAWFQLARR